MNKVNWNKLEELVYHHVGKEEGGSVMNAITLMPTKIWMSKDMLSLVAYVHLPIDEDMIIAMNWYDKFTLEQFRILRKYINNRKKEIHINSDPTNKTLVRWVENNGGYWLGDDMIFPKKG